LCGTESFHLTFGGIDVCTFGHVDEDVRKVRGLAEGGETSTQTINNQLKVAAAMAMETVTMMQGR
jgi:hypothetical protein